MNHRKIAMAYLYKVIPLNLSFSVFFSFFFGKIEAMVIERGKK